MTINLVKIIDFIFKLNQRFLRNLEVTIWWTNFIISNNTTNNNKNNKY